MRPHFYTTRGGSRTALPRQKTLRALIDWSFNLLSEPERALLRQLSVFVGGWRFEAAEAICPDLDVLDLLPQLVNKSLVVADETRGRVRYRLLETIRQYARDMLLESGETASARDRHFDYFLALSEAAEPELREGTQVWTWIDHLDEEFDNIQSALGWGQEGRPEDALLLAGNMLQFYLWAYRGDRRTAIRWLKNAIDDLDTLPPAEGAAARRRDAARMKGLYSIGLLMMGIGSITDMVDAFSEGVRMAREQHDPWLLAYGLAMLAILSRFRPDLEPLRASAVESLSLFEQIGSDVGRMIVLPTLARAARLRGDMRERQRYHDEMRQRMSQADNPILMPSLLSIGMEARMAGELDLARLYLTECLKLAKRFKGRYFVTNLESELVHTTRMSEDVQTAKVGYQRTIRTWLELGHRSAVANQLECLAFVARAQNDFARAARLFGAADVLREAIHEEMTPDEQPEYDREVAALREQMNADRLASAWREGRAMDVERAVTYATAEG